MADFTAKDVQALRQSTGAGMMDAKKALTETDGDMEAARKLLREKGLAKADDRAGRENAQGAIALASSTSAPWAWSSSSARPTSWPSPTTSSASPRSWPTRWPPGARPPWATTRTRSTTSRSPSRRTSRSGGPCRSRSTGQIVDTYLHRQDGRGVNGVVVVLEGGSKELAHDLAVHIAFAKPQYLHAGRGPGRPGRGGAPDPAHHHQGRGQARAGLAQDRRGPPERLVQGAGAARAALRPGREADRGPAGEVGGAEIVRFAQLFIGG